MSNAVFYCSFKLKEGASVDDFLQAAENLNREFIAKQKGYISWKQLVDEDTWADFITFETLDDIAAFEENSMIENKLAERFYSFIDLENCSTNHYIVERNYEN